MKRFADTFSVGFYCRPSKKTAKGTSPIQMSINLQGERFFVSLPRQAAPKQFKKMMASQLPNDLKDYLKSIEARLHQFQTECIQNGKPFTMDAIKSFIKAGYTSQGITFQALVDEFLKSLRLKLKAGGMPPKRYRKYEVAIAHFLEHGDIKPDMLVAEIKNQHILDFKHYMMSDNTPTSLYCVSPWSERVWCSSARPRPRPEKGTPFRTSRRRRELNITHVLHTY